MTTRTLAGTTIPVSGTGFTGGRLGAREEGPGFVLAGAPLPSRS
jgi:hypothetical protein